MLIRDFSTRILRGDRIGLIGPNGAGKTTLLKLILGEIEPDCRYRAPRRQSRGRLFRPVARSSSIPRRPCRTRISPGGDWVEIGSERRHVVTYLGDFLFPPERARSPVRSLSGGERNRLLLARLFARPANVLVLDEPTNDLDIETLELLEALLQDYRGTVFLVSHDRAFLDNVVTEVIAFEGDGVLREHVGGYSDWADYQARHGRPRKSADPSGTAAPPRGGLAGRKVDILRRIPLRSRSAARDGSRAGREGLSFSEARELSALPARIETLEARVEEMRRRFADPAFYRDAAQEAKALRAELAQGEQDLADAYARWEALEIRKSADEPPARAP